MHSNLGQVHLSQMADYGMDLVFKVSGCNLNVVVRLVDLVNVDVIEHSISQRWLDLHDLVVLGVVEVTVIDGLLPVEASFVIVLELLLGLVAGRLIRVLRGLLLINIDIASSHLVRIHLQVLLVVASRGVLSGMLLLLLVV